jgi:hypothetical protein
LLNQFFAGKVFFVVFGLHFSALVDKLRRSDLFIATRFQPTHFFFLFFAPLFFGFERGMRFGDITEPEFCPCRKPSKERGEKQKRMFAAVSLLQIGHSYGVRSQRRGSGGGRASRSRQSHALYGYLCWSWCMLRATNPAQTREARDS